jgi:hypothetical protein
VLVPGSVLECYAAHVATLSGESYAFRYRVKLLSSTYCVLRAPSPGDGARRSTPGVRHAYSRRCFITGTGTNSQFVPKCHMPLRARLESLPVLATIFFPTASHRLAKFRRLHHSQYKIKNSRLQRKNFFPPLKTVHLRLCCLLHLLRLPLPGCRWVVRWNIHCRRIFNSRY